MKRNPKLLYPIGVLLAAILVAVVLVAARPSPQVLPPRVPPPLVRAQVVRQQDVQLRVRSQGTVKARTESGLLSQVAGQIVSISPAFAGGGFFKSGDILVTIDPRDYKLAVARSRAQVAQARVRLTREEEEAQLARAEWDRLGRGDPSPLVLRKPQLQEARTGVEAAKAGLAQAELSLERTHVRAPYDGRVLLRNVDVGQFVSPGVPLGRIYAVDYAEVRLSIPHAELAYLDLSLRFRGEDKLLDQPEVLLRGEFAGSRHAWSGRIVRVEGQIDPLTRTVGLVARVPAPYDRIPGSDRPTLVVGLFVEAEILGRVVRDIAVLPRSALRGTDRVLVIDDEDRLHFRTVEVLRAEVTRVLVQNGLEEGERVCLSPLDAVVEGMKIRVSGSAEQGVGKAATKPGLARVGHGTGGLE